MAQEEKEEAAAFKCPLFSSSLPEAAKKRKKQCQESKYREHVPKVQKKTSHPSRRLQVVNGHRPLSS